MLKQCSESLLFVIHALFKQIFDSESIPDIWKTSIIVPVYKKGDKTYPFNYRPISLTCTLCRILERVIAQNLVDFLNHLSFFSNEQYGFLKFRSTTTQLLCCVNDWYEALTAKFNVDVIYLDFAKAFDSVPHDLLLYKIAQIGITGKLFSFLKNFLSNRTFKVKLGESYSDSFPIKSGVPQGSVLGPLLFLIYINDLPQNLPSNVTIKLYADDVKIYVHHKNDNFCDTLQHTLEAIEKWSAQWKIKLAPLKSMALYLGKSNLKRQYFLNNMPIPETNCVKDLGIMIDSNLSFNAHIEKIFKSANLKSHQLLRVLKTKNLRTLIFAYKIYVRPILEYASEIWNGKFKKHSNKIEKIQKLFTRRAIRKSGIPYAPYSERLQLCELQKLSTRRSLTDLTTVFKIIKFYTTLSPFKFFTFSQSNRNRLLTIRTRKHTAKTRHNFFVRTTNKLPTQLLQSKSPKQFFYRLKVLNVPSTMSYD